MWKNYLKIAFRNLTRNKLTSAINILGLALGMACCFVILIYVSDEKSYDQWLPDADRIHRVAIEIENNQGDLMLFAPVSGTLAPVLKDFPQVEQVTRFVQPFDESVPMSTGRDKVFYETGFFWADHNLFDVFQFKFLAGLPSSALSAPKDIVLTREMAEKYFSVKNDFSSVLNQTIKKDTVEYRITGVIEDIPKNSSFKPDFIASIEEFGTEGLIANWHATVFYTFVKLQKGADPVAFEQQISKIADKYVGEEIKSHSQDYTFFLQGLTDIRLHSNLRYEFSKNNAYQYIQLFSLVALFILLLACINFINLTTAHASKRAKEVGIRKTTGALRGQLVSQFMTETLLTSVISAIVALTLVGVALPWFNTVAEKQFTIMSLLNSQFIGLLVIITAVAGIVAGIYPAIAFSKFKAVEVFRGSFSGKKKSSFQLRNVLVVVQFSVSIALIVAMIVLSKQVQFLKQQSLGFEKEQMLVVSAPRNPTLKQNYASIRTELSKLPGVNEVCLTGIVPGKGYSNNMVVLKGDASKSTDMQLMEIDQNFLETYEIELLAGRNLSENIPEDIDQNIEENIFQSILINEAVLPFYGWKTPEEALGQVFANGWGKIVGVVKNFHYNSLHKQVLPLEMYFSNNDFNYVSLNVATSGIDQLLPELKATWETMVPGTPFEYSFLDETFDRQYHFEDRLMSLFKVFGILAILIACLGLFGLATFTAQQRVKEIGIRKVLGSTTFGIVRLLSGDFLKLVIFAFVIASPLAYYLMESWLQDFAYRINIQWWIFVFAGFTALTVATLTVSFQSVKAALANPVDSLRSE